MVKSYNKPAREQTSFAINLGDGTALLTLDVEIPWSNILEVLSALKTPTPERQSTCPPRLQLKRPQRLRGSI
jgi:hypothetical protein